MSIDKVTLYNACEGMREDAREAFAENPHLDDPGERASQAADDNENVIYTWRAIAIYADSHSDVGEYEDEYCGDGGLAERITYCVWSALEQAWMEEWQKLEGSN
jgi:hypothetical protein